MEQTALSDILSEKGPEQVQEVETEKPQEEIVEEKPRSRRKQHLAKEYDAQGRDPDTGQFLPKEEEVKEEKKAEPEVKEEVKPEPRREEFTDKERAFLRAAEEERRKRQELERRLAELEKPKQPESEKKTFWDDPEGFLKAHDQQIEQKLTQREMNAKLSTAEAIARVKYKDFDQNVEEFAQALQATPGLRESWLASQDPAEFAYRFGERTKLIREAGSLDALKAKIEKETRAKLEAEFKAKQKELEQQRAALTPSLSDVRGASKQSQPVFTGPTPFEDILKP